MLTCDRCRSDDDVESITVGYGFAAVECGEAAFLSQRVVGGDYCVHCREYIAAAIKSAAVPVDASNPMLIHRLKEQEDADASR